MSGADSAPERVQLAATILAGIMVNHPREDIEPIADKFSGHGQTEAVAALYLADLLIKLDTEL